MYHHATAIALIESTFPALAADLNDELNTGLLHPQIWEFANHAQSVIDATDRAGWELVIKTFMALWLDCDDAVRNALNVSFLEHLNFRDGRIDRRWAFEGMPSTMREAWCAMDAYNRRIHGG
ncbi:DUF7674 family protein [Roseateles chitinivorans]|uniref:DUF7674 family protein n=1 Tax=Roseateles chitinivorans TaxID=2917965 RepID=UPI003D669DBC